MKKITLLITFFVFYLPIQAQTYLQENFDTEIPATWTVTDEGGATGDSWISGQQGGANSLDGTNGVVVDSDANGNGVLLLETLTSPVFDTSGATALFLDFDQYYNNGGGDSSIVEVFDGTNWVEILNQTADIGAFGAPNEQHIDISAYLNASMQIRFIYNDADVWAWYWMVDNVQVYNSTCNNPSVLGATVDMTTVDLSWTAGGTETSWEVINQVAGGPAPTDVDSGTAASTNPYQISGLTPGTNYEYYVRANCDASGFSIWSGPFAYRISGPGETCENPLEVTTPLPFTTDDDTANYIDDYNGAPGTDCGSGNGYLNGDDVVYSYAPTADTSIDISLSNLNANYAGVFVYTDCADIGTACVTGGVNGFSMADILIDNFSVSAGTTYYIVISTWAAPQSVGYTLTLTENTCVDPIATTSVRQDCINGAQFFIDVDLTDLGSATSITISDNQGSTPQVVTATGVYSFGPFANGTGVITTVENDADANCILTSLSLTQTECVLSVIDCGLPPLQFNHCYADNDDTTWLFESSDGSPVRLTFNAGGMESCCDDILVYDGTDNTAPLIYQGNNGGNLAGLQFDSTGDSLFLEIDADGSVSCASGSGCCTTEWDFTVACATCVNPVAAYAVRQDCENGPQFYVDVDLTDLGSATSITISDDQASAPIVASAVGVYSFGPFVNNTPVVITVTNDDDANCALTSAVLTQDQCVLNTVDCSAAPLELDYCYDNNDTTSWLFVSTDGSPVRITFDAGTIEGFWDNLTIYDGADNTGAILFNNNTAGLNDFTGLTFDSTGDSLFMEVDSDGSVSCASGSRLTWEFTVACATCVNPAATYAVISDCATGPQFFVDVDLTSLGSGTSVTISDDQGSAPQTTSAIGVFTFGPFSNTTPVVITIANDDDTNCVLNSNPLTQEFCLDTIVDCGVGPVNAFYCYENNDTNVFSYTSTDGSPLNLTINSGNVENNFDELVILDSDGVTNLNAANPYGAGGDISGLTFQSTGDTIYFSVTGDFIISCASGSFPAGIEYTVACATCINPAATYVVVDDCANGDQFLIDVNVSTIGDATSVTISDNQGSTPVQITAAGTTQFGPYPFLTDIVITLNNDQDVNCVINSPAIQLLACPPANDNPCNATVALVNDNETCDLITPGTLIEATDSGVPSGSCAGNPDDDVWFEFTALNEVQLISIINTSGGFPNFDHAVYEGTCDALTEIYCSPDTASITPELVVGNTYYIRVFSAGSNSETVNFDLCIKEAPDNTVCENASPFCGEGGALYGSNVIGIPNNTSVACLGTIPNPSWNLLQIGESGPVNIQIVQNTEFDVDGNPIGTGLDVDFVLWGPFDSSVDYCELDLLVDCPTCPFSNLPDNGFYPFGDIVDCSYSAAPVEVVTIDNAIAGEIYVLLVTNFSDQAGTVQIQQTNADDTGSGAITSEIDVALGADQSFCGFPSYDLNAESPFADRYEWYADGFIIPGETGATLTVTETNTYTVIAYDDNCDAQAQDTIVVIFGMEPVANPVDDMITCDDASADEIEDFDLEFQTAGLLGTQDPADFNVTYHLTLVDAQTNTGALTSPYTNVSNPQTIYVRIEDANATFCFVTSSFDLIISGPTPTATSVDFETCDDNSRDGVESFDLTSHDANVLNGQDAATFVVSYYESEADAEAGTNAIVSPYNNTSNPQTVYARVESNVAFDCYSVVDFALIVNDVPFTTFTTDFEYEVCPNATVPIQMVATAENYTASDVTIVWYRDGGVIAGENSLTLPVLVQGFYEVEITHNVTGCEYMASIDVIELESCIIPQGISPNGDQWNQNFDLSSYDVSKLEIFNRNGTLVYSKTNYTNEWHGQTNNGDQLPVGTYFFTMEYQNGKRKSAWVYINE